jgi:2-phospho-L-lactate guanylyltransferase (CobY/MobA/RfbA family)
MTGRANEVKVARVAVRRLEARTSFAKVDLAGDAGADHPLQGAVHRGAADACRLAPDEVEQIVRADMPFLAQEDLEDTIALGRPLAPCWTQGGEIRKGTIHLVS